MSKKLLSLNADLQRLWDEGYTLEFIGGNQLVIKNIPYVDDRKVVHKDGIFISELNLNADKTIKPEHTMYFAGGVPCYASGVQHKQIINFNIPGIVEDKVCCQFSAKKHPNGYDDYYDKITTYAELLTAQARKIAPEVTATKFDIIEPVEDDSVFQYADTCTGRAAINAINAKLKGLRVGIVGLGGTGSYILDFVAKTPVAEIHLFDGDDFLQHNAFRSPGAASIEQLKQQYKKTDYLASIYNGMHRFISSHPYFLTEENVGELLVYDFVFIAVDRGSVRKLVIEALMQKGIPFIDTGMGIDELEGKQMLEGMIRTTLAAPGNSEHVSKRISFKDGGEDIYDRNIQIADLNALNAVFAIIKWKKYYGLYWDRERELDSSYIVPASEMINNDPAV